MPVKEKFDLGCEPGDKLLAVSDYPFGQIKKGDIVTFDRQNGMFVHVKEFRNSYCVYGGGLRKIDLEDLYPLYLEEEYLEDIDTRIYNPDLTLEHSLSAFDRPKRITWEPIEGDKIRFEFSYPDSAADPRRHSLGRSEAIISKGRILKIEVKKTGEDTIPNLIEDLEKKFNSTASVLARLSAGWIAQALSKNLRRIHI